jgi:hypothetical protein
MPRKGSWPKRTARLGFASFETGLAPTRQNQYIAKGLLQYAAVAMPQRFDTGND